MKNKLHKAKHKVRIGKDGYKSKNILIFALIFACLGTYVIVKSFAATPSCDFHVTSSATLTTALNSATGNTGSAVICLAAGTYNNFDWKPSYPYGTELTKSKMVTMTADTGVNASQVHIGGSVGKSAYLTFDNMTIASIYI